MTAMPLLDNLLSDMLAPHINCAVISLVDMSSFLSTQLVLRYSLIITTPSSDMLLFETCNIFSDIFATTVLKMSL